MLASWRAWVTALNWGATRLRMIQNIKDDLPVWTAKVRAKDPEWDEKLRRLYPKKHDPVPEGDDFNDQIPF